MVGANLAAVFPSGSKFLPRP